MPIKKPIKKPVKTPIKKEKRRWDGPDKCASQGKKQEGPTYVVIYHHHQDFETRINEQAAKGYSIISSGGGSGDSYVIMKKISNQDL